MRVLGGGGERGWSRERREEDRERKRVGGRENTAEIYCVLIKSYMEKIPT